MKGGDTMENENDVTTREAKTELTAEAEKTAEENPLAYRKRKRRLGDRSDGRRLRSLEPMHKLMPFIMARRSDALNTFYDRIDVGRAEDLCRKKAREGLTHFTILHVILASYLRTVAERPGINRFVSGQRIFARNEIVFVMTVKKEMALNAPETLIKVKFNPTDTLDTVYEKFNTTAQEAIASLDNPTSFDKVCKLFNVMPRFMLRFLVWLLNWLDYHGIMPKSLLEVLPFYGSMIITSMGSLGINPIYHHIYDFGNLPVFISYGMKKVAFEYDRKGNLSKHRYIELKVVTDERICDGHYFASAFKIFRRYVEHPEMLEVPPERIYEDVD